MRQQPAAATDGAPVSSTTKIDPASVIWRRNEARCREAVTHAAWAASAVASIALLGTALHIPLASSLMTDAPVASANASTGILLIACALLCRRSKSARVRIVALVSVAFASLLGAATGLEWVLGRGFGIDGLLAGDKDSARMAPTAAAALLAVAATTLRTLRRPNVQSPLPSIVGAATAAVAVDAVLGVLLGTGAALRGPQGAAMSAPTGLAFIALGFALICTQPRAGLAHAFLRPDLAGLVMRRLVPVVLAVPLGLGAVSFLAPRFGGGRLAVAAATVAPAALLLWFLLKAARDVQRAYRKQQDALSTLIEAESRQRVVLDSLLDHGLVCLSPEGRIVALTNTAERLTGWKTSEVIGHPYAALHPPRDGGSAAVAEKLRTVLREGRVEEESPRARKGGSTFLADSVLSALRAPDGHLLGFVEILRDVTARRRAEGEDARANKQAEAEALQAAAAASAAQTARDAAAHTAMQARADKLSHTGAALRSSIEEARALLESGFSSPQQNEHLASVLAGALAHSLRADDVFEHAALEAGRLELLRVSFEVRPFLLGLGRMLAPAAHAKGLDLVVDVRPDVPTAVYGDPKRLSQVLLNLLDNAIAVSTRGDVVLACDVSFKTAGEPRLELMVRDTGPGLSAELAAAIIDGVESGETPALPTLGLRRVARLVARLGGTVHVQRTAGAGTAFELSFRCEADASVQPEKEAAPPRLLVVDDRTRSRDGVVGLLAAVGVQADGAAAAAALSQGRDHAAHEDPYQAIVVDGNVQTDLQALLFSLSTELSFPPALVVLARTGASVRAPADVHIERVLKPASAAAVLAAVAQARENAAAKIAEMVAQDAQRAAAEAAASEANKAAGRRAVEEAARAEAARRAAEEEAARVAAEDEAAKAEAARIAAEAEAARIAAEEEEAAKAEAARVAAEAEAARIAAEEEAAQALAASPSSELNLHATLHDAVAHGTPGSWASDVADGTLDAAAILGLGTEEPAVEPTPTEPEPTTHRQELGPPPPPAEVERPLESYFVEAAPPPQDEEPPPPTPEELAKLSAFTATLAVVEDDLSLAITSAFSAFQDPLPQDPPTLLPEEAPPAVEVPPPAVEAPPPPARSSLSNTGELAVAAARTPLVARTLSLSAFADSSVAFDPKAILRQTGQDSTLLTEFALDAVREHEALLEQLREALGRRDDVAARDVAHRLVGALKNLSAGPAGQVAEAIEEATTRHEITGPLLKLPRLESELGRLAAALSGFAASAQAEAAKRELTNSGAHATVVRQTGEAAAFSSPDRTVVMQPPPFDPQTLLRQVGGDRDLLIEVARDAAREHGAILGQLTAALERRDSDGATSAAHRLTGALTSLSATPAAQIAIAIEEAAARREITGPMSKLPRLEAELARLSEALLSMGQTPGGGGHLGA